MSIRNSMSHLESYKVFKEATDLLDEATANDLLPCPLEYAGKCNTRFACDKCENANINWEFVLLEMVKEKEESHEQV